MALTPFDLAGYFVDDAGRLVAARERAIKVHRNKDIDAAGDEVEIPVRAILRERLPRRYHVGHGHIVDSELKTSRQLDLIIADDANTPVLFRAQNGTEFMPYESVYAIGEARSSYSKSKKPIEAFSGVIDETLTGLQRQRTTFAMTTNGETNVIRQNPLGLNPLFSFMLFVNGDEFDFEDVRGTYGRTSPVFLPNAVCVLDKGVILRAEFMQDGNTQMMQRIIINPSTEGPPRPGHSHHWIFIGPNEADQDRNMGFSLALLHFMLFGTLSNSYLLPPEMTGYLNRVLLGYKTQILG